MVHKKSEYQLNYRWNPSNLYHETWESGFAYRVQRRQYDLSHLPLPWEVHGCKCDCIVDEEETAHLPIPKTRLKHNILNEEWERSKQEEQAKKYMLESKPMVDVADLTNEDWYRRWEEREHQQSPTRTSPLRKSSPERKMPMNNEVIASAQTKPRSHLDESITNKQQEIDRERSIYHPTTTLPNVQLNRGTQTVPVWGSPSKQFHRKDLQVSQPTQTLSCMPKFIPYGWASKRDISDKKTFNVFAPTRHLNEFYPSALRAWKRREDEIMQNIELECRSPKPRVVRSTANVLVNPSSVWMTEYQKQFTTRTPSLSRPVTAPPGHLRQAGSIFHKFCV